jgi:hypothetical protein
VDAKHHLIVKKLDEEMNNEVRMEVEKQPTKKRQNVSHLKFLNYSMQNFLTR